MCLVRCENAAERGDVAEATATSEKRFAAETSTLQQSRFEKGVSAKDYLDEPSIVIIIPGNIIKGSGDTMQK